MSSESENPFQSPTASAVAAPWRKWHVWWGASALMLAVVLPVLIRDRWSGGLLCLAATGVCLRSMIDLHRKHQADWTITAQTQFSSLGRSLLMVIMAGIGSYIAFMLSCTGMAMVTNAPIIIHSTEAERADVQVHWQFVFGTAYIFTVFAFGILIWLMGPPTLEVLRKKNLDRGERNSPAESSESHE